MPRSHINLTVPGKRTDANKLKAYTYRKVWSLTQFMGQPVWLLYKFVKCRTAVLDAYTALYAEVALRLLSDCYPSQSKVLYSSRNRRPGIVYEFKVLVPSFLSLSTVAQTS